MSRVPYGHGIDSTDRWEPPEAPEPPDYSGIDLEFRYACSRCGDVVNELGCPDHYGAPCERIGSEE